MAKLTLLGDALQIKSSITEDILEKVKRFSPKTLKLIDENGNEIFAIDKGNASTSPHGILFPSADPEGRLFTTILCPDLEHKSYYDDKEAIKRNFSVMLYNLRKVEDQIRDALETVIMIERDVEDSIHIEDEPRAIRSNDSVETEISFDNRNETH